MKQRRLKAITLEEAVEKNSILLSQHWKKEQLDSLFSILKASIINSPTVTLLKIC